MRSRRLLVLPVLLVSATPLLLLSPNAQATVTQSAPSFVEYHAPAALTGAAMSGEPSLGYLPKTGDVLYMSNKATEKVTTFTGKTDGATWTDITDPVEGAQTSDPILYTDPVTGRSYVNQLELQGGSLQAYTDDEGATYTHSTMGAGIGLSFDHQTIAAGKPAPGQTTLPAPIGYPNYLYYCTNDLYAADCATSIDGGLNFLASTPVYVGELANGPCAAIFGHIKTDPRDGTIYLPPNGCNGKQMLYVSHDNNLSWTGYPVPGSTDGDSGHPSVAVGRQDGGVYYAWGSADGFQGITGRTQVAASFDQGKTFSKPVALGKDLGVVTSRFPVVVAGDKGRAAVAFLGAKATGDPSAAPDPTDSSVKPYTGTWDLYVSYTTDSGKTWTTYDATPKNPVQRGPVCTRGTTCLAGRNLLDFNDMVIDTDGHVVLSIADGAIKPADTYATDLAEADIVRQSGGPLLYATATTQPVQTNPGRPATPPKGQPGRPVATGKKTLASTGLAPVLPLAALGLLGGGLLLRRRRAAHA